MLKLQLKEVMIDVMKRRLFLRSILGTIAAIYCPITLITEKKLYPKLTVAMLNEAMRVAYLKPVSEMIWTNPDVVFMFQKLMNERNENNG